MDRDTTSSRLYTLYFQYEQDRWNFEDAWNNVDPPNGRNNETNPSGAAFNRPVVSICGEHKWYLLYGHITRGAQNVMSPEQTELYRKLNLYTRRQSNYTRPAPGKDVNYREENNSGGYSQYHIPPEEENDFLEGMALSIRLGWETCGQMHEMVFFNNPQSLQYIRETSFTGRSRRNSSSEPLFSFALDVEPHKHVEATGLGFRSFHLPDFIWTIREFLQKNIDWVRLFIYFIYLS